MVWCVRNGYQKFCLLPDLLINLTLDLFDFITLTQVSLLLTSLQKCWIILHQLCTALILAIFSIVVDQVCSLGLVSFFRFSPNQTLIMLVAPFLTTLIPLIIVQFCNLNSVLFQTGSVVNVCQEVCLDFPQTPLDVLFNTEPFQVESSIVDGTTLACPKRTLRYDTLRGCLPSLFCQIESLFSHLVIGFNFWFGQLSAVVEPKFVPIFELSLTLPVSLCIPALSYGLIGCDILHDHTVHGKAKTGQHDSNHHRVNQQTQIQQMRVSHNTSHRLTFWIKVTWRLQNLFQDWFRHDEKETQGEYCGQNCMGTCKE